MLRAASRDNGPSCEIALDKLSKLLSEAGAPSDIAGNVHINGHENVIASAHRLAAISAAAIGAQAAAAGAIWRARSGEDQSIDIDLVDAVRAINSTNYIWQNGVPIGLNRRHRHRDPLSDGYYRTRDGRYFKMNGYNDSLRRKSLGVLQAQSTQDSIAASIAKFESADLEERFAEAGSVGTVVRSVEEWRALPHAQRLAKLPALQITRIADGPALDLAPANRPLHGIRALELAQVIAGPVVGRTLAEHGADVLRIGHIDRADEPHLVIDTGFGKRSAYLDLNDPGERTVFFDLLKDAHIFTRSLSGDLERKGLSPDELAHHKPGLIQVRITCYGPGPWFERRGFDPNSQAATGIVWTEGDGKSPGRLPTALLADFMSGYLGAAGAMIALGRRAKEGGSWLVDVSLAQTAMWAQSFGYFKPEDYERWPKTMPPPGGAISTMTTPFGEIGYLRPIARFSKTPPRWDQPPQPLGSSKPAWTI